MALIFTSKPSCCGSFTFLPFEHTSHTRNALLNVCEGIPTYDRDKSLPSMSRCCSEGQLAASSSMSESQTVRLAVRKSLRRRGRQRARYWKHPVLLCSVGHQPRSNSSSILNNHRQTRKPGWLRQQIHTCSGIRYDLLWLCGLQQSCLWS